MHRSIERQEEQLDKLQTELDDVESAVKPPCLQTYCIMGAQFIHTIVLPRSKKESNQQKNRKKCHLATLCGMVPTCKKTLP